MERGKFFGIGIGPGCPDLITVRGAKLIETADVIYVPTKDKIENSVAYKTIKPYIKNSEIKPAIFSMSYSKKTLDDYRNITINNIKKDLESGKNVVFVTLGDTMLYSTYVYILNGLKRLIKNLPYETVPGITSFSAMASKTDTPLIEEDEVLTIYPLTYFSKEKFDILYKNSDSMVLMKIPKRSSEIINHIKDKNFSKIVHMKNICLENEEISFDLAKEELSDDTKRKYLSIILLKK